MIWTYNIEGKILYQPFLRPSLFLRKKFMLPLSVLDLVPCSFWILGLCSVSSCLRWLSFSHALLCSSLETKFQGSSLYLTFIEGSENWTYNSNNFELNITHHYSKNPSVLPPEEFSLGPISPFSWDWLWIQVSVVIFSSYHFPTLNALSFLSRAIELFTPYSFPKL